MLMVLLGRLPQTSDSAAWEGWRFKIVDVDGKRVDKVLDALSGGAAILNGGTK